MNENLDLAKILDGCPVGTEFYSSLFGKVWLVYVDLDSDYPIRFSIRNDNTANESVTKKGTHLLGYNGECVFFPSKDQRDWSKFERFWDKPKVERFDPKTLQPFDKVLVRDCSNDTWRIEFFSHKKDGSNLTKGLFDNWFCTIPYNEDTKHLLGTKEDCPEYYKWWEE